MAGILTKKFGVAATQLLIDDIKSRDSSYYVFVGRSTPWVDENSPPAANQALNSYEHSAYNNILYGKRVSNSDVINLIPRYDWANNTLYAAYDKDDVELYNKKFFVYNTDSGAVYKLLERGQGNSVVRPSIIIDTPFRTSDGHTWKYMYTVSASDYNKFGSADYIPVTPNTEVIAAATPGSIDTIKVVTGGAGWYTYNTGTLQSVINASAVIISSNGSTNNDFYVGSSLYLKSGLGSSQTAEVVDYDGVSRIAILNPPMIINTNLILANTVGTFNVGDTVTQNLLSLGIVSQSGYIQPGDTITQSGTGASGVIITSNNSVFRVAPLTSTEFINDRAVDAGRGVTIGNSTVTTSTSTNTVTAAANARFLSVYSSGDYIRVGNTTVFHSHRVTAVANNTSLTVAGPFTAAYTANAHYKVNSAATIASVTNITATATVGFSDLSSVELTINNPTSTFTQGEIVTQSTTSTNGVVSFANTSKLILTATTGPGFLAANTITGVESNTTANVSIVSSYPTITVTDASRGFVYGSAITGSSGGSATVVASTTLPNEQTEYVISPKVTITGDGVGAGAYSVVNAVTSAISSIVMFNTGTGYTNAVATVSANPNYGVGARLAPNISPITGHGSDPITELGGNYIAITSNFANSYNEAYNIPGYGSFRTIGVIKSPSFDNVFLNVNNYTYATITVSGSSGVGFAVGEVLHQPGLATGTIISVDLPTIKINTLKGEFTTSTANTTLAGLSTGTTATITAAEINQFVVSGNVAIFQANTGASGTLVSANTNTLRITDAVGTFVTGEPVYAPSTNSYATVIAGGVRTANNTKTLTFNTFNQVIRATLSTESGSFENNERVTFRTPLGNTIATAAVYNTTNDKDISITGLNGTFVTNELVLQDLNASGVIVGSNSSYLKLTSVIGTFTPGSNIFGQTSTANATVGTAYSVLQLTDVDGPIVESQDNYLIGDTSGAIAYMALANTVTRPSLVRDTGSVLYIENISPITRTDTSTESVKLIVKF